LGLGAKRYMGRAMPNFIAAQTASQAPLAGRKISNLAELEQLIENLIRIEPRFARVVQAHGIPTLRTAEASLETLLQIVTEQFLSLKAAAVIWNRLAESLKPFDPDHILNHDEGRLMALGLSRAKARSFHGLARAVQSGALDFALLHNLPEAEAHKALCKLPGIGPWSAAIFNLGALAHSDAWPAGDLALQVAAQDLLQLPHRPTPKEMLVIAESWRPHRAVAARLLWAHYRDVKGLAQAADSPSQN
jgi:DNA-3-methyladenine glycosylase II